MGGTTATVKRPVRKTGERRDEVHTYVDNVEVTFARDIARAVAAWKRAGKPYVR